MLKGAGTNQEQTYKLVHDHLGSVRMVINTASGEVMQELDFDEWGETITDTNPGFQPFGYAGGLVDNDTKLIRFGARDYDPQAGTWTTKDPIGLAGGLNVYGYANNNPISFADPTGRVIYRQGSVYTDIQPSSGPYEIADMSGNYITGWRSSDESGGSCARQDRPSSGPQYGSPDSQSEPQSGRSDYNLDIPPGDVNIDWDTFFPTQTKGGFAGCALKVIAKEIGLHVLADGASHVTGWMWVKKGVKMVTPGLLSHGISTCVIDSVGPAPNPNYKPYGR